MKIGFGINNEVEAFSRKNVGSHAIKAAILENGGATMNFSKMGQNGNRNKEFC